jgi:iron complex transport system substrate-binding protein
MAGYISELNAENLIIGVSNPEYIYSEKIQNLIKQEKFRIWEASRNMTWKKLFR